MKMTITGDIALADLCIEFQGELFLTLRIRALGGLQCDVSRLFENCLTYIMVDENREHGESVCAHQQEPQNCRYLLGEKGRHSGESPLPLQLLR